MESLHAASIVISGDGWPVEAAPSHPKGILYSGGYDSETNTLYLAGVAGHPQGMQHAGGDASKMTASGLRLFRAHLDSDAIYWADDSFSLPRKLSTDERSSIRHGLEIRFPGCTIHHVARLQDVPSS